MQRISLFFLAWFLSVFVSAIGYHQDNKVLSFPLHFDSITTIQIENINFVSRNSSSFSHIFVNLIQAICCNLKYFILTFPSNITTILPQIIVRDANIQMGVQTKELNLSRMHLKASSS